MFDIAFTELLVIGIIALIVIGPERLPKVARSVGQWLGKLNRYVSQVKHDIDRDLKLEELRKMQQEMVDSAQRFEIMANDTAREVETTVEQQTVQISKVMQAMSVTDGGLAANEWEKLKTEQQALGTQAQARDEAALPASGVALPASGVAPGPSSEPSSAELQATAATQTAETAPQPVAREDAPRQEAPPADKTRVAATPRPASDFPDGSVV